VSPRRGAQGEVRMLRYVPVASPVHRLWAGTKLLAVLGLGIALSLRPSWPAIALVGGAVAVALAVARIPRGAVPRVPRWLLAMVALGAPLSALSSMPPHVELGAVSLSAGALEEWLRFTVLALVLLAAVAVVGWTTQLADLAPALRRLLGPLAVVRVPVDDVAITTALCARCLPILLEEVRVLIAARRLRPPVHYPSRRERFRAGVLEPIDLLVATVSVSLRRAQEMADAMEARGGAVTPSGGVGPAARDALTFVLVALVVAAAVFVG
jgi:energy-coupling factor transport system permease protein